MIKNSELAKFSIARFFLKGVLVAFISNLSSYLLYGMHCLGCSSLSHLQVLKAGIFLMAFDIGVNLNT